MWNKYVKKLKKSEAGYASFVITLVTILVVSLIVIAFATDANLEQKNSLSNNLATQAYYAAESGINDAYAVISTDIQNNTPVSPTPNNGTGCAAAGSPYLNNTNSNQLNGSNVEYSCLIVNPNPDSLQIDPLEPGKGAVEPITTTSDIASITVSWEESGYSGSMTFTGCPSYNSKGASFPTISNYSDTQCTAGILQLDMISGNQLASELSTTNPNPFSSNATTYYLIPEPNNPGGPISNANNSVYVDYVDCNSSGAEACTETIPVSPDTTYYLNMQSFYEYNDVVISAQSSNGTNLNISGAQILIDSTGVADGQLKRLQERVCYNDYCNSLDPSAAIQSTDCINKNFDVYPNDPSNNPANNGVC